MVEQDFERLNNIHNVEVLIISPEIDSCLLMKAYFLKKQCKVYVADTEVEALSKLTEIQPDVILIDRLICADINLFVDRVKALAPDARLIIQNQLEDIKLTEKEKRLAERLIAGEPVTNNRFLTYIIILIVILFVLQLVYSR